MIDRIKNPKIRAGESFSSTWYKFYPGFSESFARSALSAAALTEGDWVLDPWNGGGTTTSTAVSLGLNVYGYDLNPVMVIVAKARCLDPADYQSLKPLAGDLGRKAKKLVEVPSDDPLLTWLVPGAVAATRGIEAAIQKLLVDDTQYLSIESRGTDAVSDLAAFFYVALFRTLRSIFRPFRTSNPTWLKRPSSRSGRLRPDGETLREVFKAEVEKMLPLPIVVRKAQRAERILKVGSSEKLLLPEESVSFVLASPPYCTRIDYAIATSAELSLLGFSAASGFSQLRRSLMGTATVPKIRPVSSPSWGSTCLEFLARLRAHTSKASETYYYKNHLQYFSSLSSSIREIARVLRSDGKIVVVVQDSYYKDLHNDLPVMLTEMANSSGLAIEGRSDFALSQTMAGINPRAKGYRDSFSATESVLLFRKSSRSIAKQINNIPNVV